MAACEQGPSVVACSIPNSLESDITILGGRGRLRGDPVLTCQRWRFDATEVGAKKKRGSAPYG
jgi:hypothetical protein